MPFQFVEALRTPIRRFVLCAQEERSRWPLWLPVGLGFGIGLYFAWPVEPPLWIGWTMALGLAGAARWTKSLGREGRAFLIGGLAVIALGFGLGGVRTWWVAHPVLVAETGPVSVTGQVVEVEPRPSAPRLTLEKLNIPSLSPAAVPQRIRVSLAGKQPDIAAGDWVSLRAQLAPPPPPAAPGAFDFQRQSYFRGLGGVGFAYGQAKIVERPPLNGWSGLVLRFQNLRLDLAGRVRAQVPGDAGRVASALMTGERAAIPDDVMDAMRASGLAHLLAISGLHVGLVAGIVFFWVRFGLVLVPGVALGWSVKKVAALAALGGALFYALLAGWTVPTQRAFLMAALVLVAVLVDRRALTMRSVALAAGVILCLTPEALLGASFQLSFAAVVALIAVYETLRDQGRLKPNRMWWRRAAGYAMGVALSTAIAGTATATFAAFHFNRVADYGLAANIVAVPVMALWIMPLAVAGFALMPFGIESIALVPMGWGVDLVLTVAHEVSSWSGAQRSVPAFSVWGLALVALGGLWLALWQRAWRAWGLALVLAGLASTELVRPPDVLIDGTGKLAAVRMADGGYALSTLRSKRFERDVWLRRAGLDDHAGLWSAASLDLAGGHGGDRVQCDAIGCVYRFGPTVRDRIAFVHAPEALAEDCQRARVVVDLSGAPPSGGCKAATVIDRLRLQHGGAHALWFEADGAVRVQNVNDWRGDRPWVLGVHDGLRSRP